MRITNNVLVNNLRRNLWNNIKQMENTQMQLATGNRINKPSDDPAGIVDTLRYSSRIIECKQYQDNVEDAISWLNATDDALSSLTDCLHRVHEICVYGANGTLADEDRQILAIEVEQIMDEVKSIINTSQGDRYLFAGNNTTQKPYDGGVWTDNTNLIKYEISVGIEIPVNITAQEVFKDQDLLGTLQNVIDHLNASDTTQLSGNDLLAINSNLEQVLASQAQVGARVNRLELTNNRLMDQETNFAKLQSEVQGADIAQVIMDLKNQENVYQSSLSVGARIIMPTLMDFIR